MGFGLKRRCDEHIPRAPQYKNKRAKTFLAVFVVVFFLSASRGEAADFGLLVDNAREGGEMVGTVVRAAAQEVGIAVRIRGWVVQDFFSEATQGVRDALAPRAAAVSETFRNGVRTVRRGAWEGSARAGSAIRDVAETTSAVVAPRARAVSETLRNSAVAVGDGVRAGAEGTEVAFHGGTTAVDRGLDAAVETLQGTWRDTGFLFRYLAGRVSRGRDVIAREVGEMLADAGDSLQTASREIQETVEDGAGFVQNVARSLVGTFNRLTSRTQESQLARETPVPSPPPAEPAGESPPSPPPLQQEWQTPPPDTPVSSPALLPTEPKPATIFPPPQISPPPPTEGLSVIGNPVSVVPVSAAAPRDLRVGERFTVDAETGNLISAGDLLFTDGSAVFRNLRVTGIVDFTGADVRGLPAAAASSPASAPAPVFISAVQNASISGSFEGLDVRGNGTIRDLTVNNNATVSGSLTVTSNLTVNGALNASGDTLSLSDTLSVTGTGTSTFSGSIQTTVLNVTSTSATSTFANGIQLSGGCFRTSDGSCAGGNSANTALSNLASVAINTSLISDTNNTDDLGSAALSWKDIYASGTLRVGSASAATSTILGSLNLGAGTPSRSNQANGSLYVTGNAEFDGTANFDGVVNNRATIVSFDNIIMNDNINLVFGTNNNHRIANLTAQTPDALVFSAATGDDTFIFGRVADVGTDFKVWDSGHPIIFVHAAGTTLGQQAGLQYDSLILTNGTATTSIATTGTSTFASGLAPTSTANNTLDLGGFGSAWRGIYASGTIYGGSLSVTGTGTSTISGGLEVQGMIFASSTNGNAHKVQGDLNLTTASGDYGVDTAQLQINTNNVTNKYGISIVGGAGNTGFIYRPNNGAEGSLSLGSSAPMQLAITNHPIEFLQNSSAYDTVTPYSFQFRQAGGGTRAVFVIEDDAALSAQIFRIENDSSQPLFTVSPGGLIHASGTLSLTSTGTSTFGGGVAPTSTLNNTLDLGGFGSAWRNIYASSSIHVGASGATSTVTGNLQITGELQVGGHCTETNGACADLAEMYEASEPVVPGDVLVLDAETSRLVGMRVKKSAGANAVNVVGVVSTAPAMTFGLDNGVLVGGGAADPLRPAVALVGRVPVNVTDEGGPVNAGDLLVTASKSGFAKRADSAGGAIIGMALEPFPVGEGQILVMVRNGSAPARGETQYGPKVLTVEVEEGGQRLVRVDAYDFEGARLMNVRAIASASGLWEINEEGQLVAKRVEAEEIVGRMFKVRRDEEARTIGHAGIPANQTSFTVSNDQIAKESRIFLTFRTNPGSVWWISGQGDGWFEVSLTVPQGSDVTFDYWIIGIEGEIDDLTADLPAGQAGISSNEAVPIDGGGGGEPVDGGAPQEPQPENPSETIPASEPPPEDTPVVETAPTAPAEEDTTPSAEGTVNGTSGEESGAPAGE